jgi:hypothetical protein
LTKPVVSHELVELVIMGNGMRAWTHKRHATIKNVQQLRQFVDACSS